MRVEWMLGGLGGEWIEGLGNIMYVGSEHLSNDDSDTFSVVQFYV